jgi:hypothetical protein
VLDSEHAEQYGVDDQGRDKRTDGSAVDGLGDRQIFDKGDGVEEHPEEKNVARHAVEHR